MDIFLPPVIMQFVWIWYAQSDNNDKIHYVS